jgi:2-methylcitrate dehydratase
MRMVEQLAAFVTRSSYDDLSVAARQALKTHILGTLGCASAALDRAPMRAIRAQPENFGATQRCALIGGGRTAPDRAASYNSALVRYLDFNDSYLVPSETCHPNDNLAPCRRLPVASRPVPQMPTHST